MASSETDDWQEVPVRAPASVADDWQEVPVAAHAEDWKEVPLTASDEALKAGINDIAGKGMFDSASASDRGAVGTALDITKAAVGSVGTGAKDIYNSAVAGKNAFESGVNNTLPENLAGAAIGAAELPFKTISAGAGLIGKAAGVVDRVAGSAAAGVYDAATSAEDFLFDTTHESVLAAARARGLLAGDIQDPNEISFKNLFPVRLIEDVAAPIGEGLFNKAGEALDQSNSKILKETGEFMHYVAPAAGLVAGLVAFEGVGSIPSFGALTEAGVEAEKAGELTGSIAQQVERGERNLVNLKVGPVEVQTSFGKVGIKAAEAASKLSVALDTGVPIEIGPLKFTTPAITKPLQSFATYGPFQSVNAAMEKLGITSNQDNYNLLKMFRGVPAQIEKHGIDLENPKTASEVASFLDNPTTFRGDKAVAEAGDDVFQYLNGELKKANENARLNGMPIKQKEFFPKEEARRLVEEEATQAKSDFRDAIPGTKEYSTQKAKITNLQKKLDDIDAQGDYSERYVPRSPGKGKVEELRASEAVKEAARKNQLGEYDELAGDAENAQKILEGMGIVPKGGSAMGRFNKLRDRQNLVSMNAQIEKELEVKDFFSTDVVSSYGDTINDINKSVRERKFAASALKYGVTSDGELFALKTNALEKMAQSVNEGRVIDPEHYRLSLLQNKDLTHFRDLPENVKSRLIKFEELSPETFKDVQKMSFPTAVANQLSENLIPQRLQSGWAAATASQNLFKAFLTANPGFIVRNWFQTYTMARAAGVKISEIVKSAGGLIAGKGGWADGAEEYASVTSGMGSYGKISQDLSSVERLRQIAKVEITAADMAANGDNAFKRLMYQFRQMGSVGKWEDFKKDITGNTLEAIRNNPVFKASSAIGHGGEDIPKFAYFSKLREEGYSAEAAITKVNRQFLNFNNTRLATKYVSTVFPFANHAIKNAEVTMRILAASPGSAMMWGRDGAFSRAIENWAGWDPDRNHEYREMLGRGYSQDQIYLTVAPGRENMLKHKSVLQDFVDAMFYSTPAGKNLMFSLPSNFHALSMFDPRYLDEMSGPLVKAAIAGFGKDPFTGQNLPPLGATQGLQIRLAKAADQFLDPMFPRTSMNIARGMLDKIQEEWTGNAARLGEGKEFDAVYSTTPQMKRAQNDIQKALVKGTTLWRGNFTNLDLDLGYRITSKLNDMKETKRYLMSGVRSGKAGQEAIARFQDGYRKDAAEIQNMVHVKEDYENHLKKVQAPAWQVVGQDKADPPPVSTPEGGLNESDSAVTGLRDQATRDPAMSGAPPQQGGNDLMSRSGDLQRRMITPQIYQSPQDGKVYPNSAKARPEDLYDSSKDNEVTPQEKARIAAAPGDWAAPDFNSEHSTDTEENQTRGNEDRLKEVKTILNSDIPGKREDFRGVFDNKELWAIKRGEYDVEKGISDTVSKLKETTQDIPWEENKDRTDSGNDEFAKKNLTPEEYSHYRDLLLKLDILNNNLAPNEYHTEMKKEENL